MLTVDVCFIAFGSQQKVRPTPSKSAIPHNLCSEKVMSDGHAALSEKEGIKRIAADLRGWFAREDNVEAWKKATMPFSQYC